MESVSTLAQMHAGRVAVVSSTWLVSNSVIIIMTSPLTSVDVSIQDLSFEGKMWASWHGIPPSSFSVALIVRHPSWRCSATLNIATTAYFLNCWEWGISFCGLLRSFPQLPSSISSWRSWVCEIQDTHESQEFVKRMVCACVCVRFSCGSWVFVIFFWHAFYVVFSFNVCNYASSMSLLVLLIEP